MGGPFQHSRAALLYALSCATAFVALPPNVSAQEVAEADGEPAAGGATGIEEIVVTARRRKEALQDVPASVYTTSQEQMFITGNDSMTGLRDVISNVNFGSDLGTRSRVNVRGLGSDRSGNQANGVGFFVDGVYQNGTARFNAPFLDVERVEVLKGPQGARYGRNAFAGVVNVITRRPDNEFHVAAQSELESEGGRKLSASLSGPIVEGQLFGKLSYAHSETEGDYRHAVTRKLMMSSEDDFFDARLLWQPTDRLEFDLKWSTGEHQGPGYAYSQVGSLQQLSENFVMDDDQSAGLKFNETTLGTTFRADAFEVINRLGYYDAHTFYDIDADFSALDIVRAGLDVYPTQWTDELRIQSAAGGPLNWLLGGEIVRADARSRATSTLRPGLCAVLGIPSTSCPFPSTSVGLGKGDTDVWSVFAELSYEFAQRLELTISARYDDIKADSVVPTPGQTFKDSALQPLASLRYRIDDNGSVYASAARGIRQGGFNPVTVKAEFRPYDSDDVTTYEIGHRRTLPSVKGHFNLAAFYSDVDTMNHYIGLPPAPGFTTFPGVFSLGGAESYGVEMDLDLALTDHLRWNGAAGWLNCELKDIPTLTGSDYTAVPGGLRNGAQCVDSADWTFSTSLSGEWPLGASDWQVIGSLSASGRGHTLLVYDAGTPSTLPREQRSFRRSEQVQQPVYLLDANLGFRNGNWSFLVYADNLTDELYATQNTSAEWLRDFGMIWITDNEFRVNLAPRRRIGVRLRYDF